VWRWQLVFGRFGIRVSLRFFANNVIAKINALVANKYRRASNELSHFMLAFAAKGTIQ
jgi:hypothetical protein